jgi:hypothetical protein
MEPFQTHLAPVIIYVDGYADNGIDLQAQFPTAFETKPEDVASYFKGTNDNADIGPWATGQHPEVDR